MIEYRIIQFFPQPERAEAKNIGVIVFDEGWVGFKALGMIERVDKPDYTAYSFLPKVYHDSLWVFGEWIRWFQSLCRDTEGNNEHIHGELNQLALHSPLFHVTDSAYFNTQFERRNDALDLIFLDVVGTPTKTKEPVFEDHLEKLLIKSELAFDPAFESGIEVTATLDINEVAVFILDYFYAKNEKLVGIKNIRLQKAQYKALDTKVNDAIYAFTTAQNINMLTKNTSIVLIDTPPNQRKAAYVSRLQAVATVIDITKPEAATKLLNICT